MKIVSRVLVTLFFTVCLNLHAGNLKVNLAPTAAVSAGAQWRVDGGTWRSSGTTVSNLSNASHPVDFKAVSGWIAPASTTTTLTNGTTTTLTGTYIQAASLKITLTPSSGQWRIDGGTWRTSGATATDLAPGNHSVDYASVSGYAVPAVETVTLTAGQTTTLTRTYTQLARITLTLSPSSAQWQVDGGTWQTSGSTVANLSVGSHTIAYSALSGYASPATESVTLAAGQLLTLSRSYVQLAQLTISLTPTTAQWRVDGGTWRASGVAVANLTPGTHTVDYAPLAGYTAPSSESVSLAAGQAMSFSRGYVQLAQISITLSPSTAQWNVDGGAWQASGVTVANLTPGSHAVAYSAVNGYISPAAESVTLTTGQSLSLNRSYVQLAQVTVILSHPSGQWQIDGGAWQASGATVSNLTPGIHTLSYSSLINFATPASESITLTAGQPLTLSRVYVQLAQIIINVTPTSGQWRINGGAWQANGASLMVMPGSYAIDYSTLALYDSPAPENITLAAGGFFGANRSYVSQKPALRINLAPTGQWRVDAGSWQNSGTRLADLDVGAHTIDYTDVGGQYSPLPSESITLALRDDTTLTRTYPLKPSTLQVNLTPGTGQWRAYQNDYSSDWQPSGATLTGLIYASYNIAYSSLANYDSPATENVSVSPGQALTITRAYTARAQVTVTLDPTGGQWNIDGSAWLSSGVTIANLAPGSHTVGYSPLANYDAPSSETLTLSSGQTAALSRTYTPHLAQLTVTTDPSSGQWRIYPDQTPPSGSWNASGATVTGITPGTYTVAYNALPGYTAPATASVVIGAGEIKSIAAAYTPQPAQLSVTLTPNTAQWRVDGGGWQASGATVTSLTTGSHAVDYSVLANYNAPAAETVTLVPGQSATLTRSYVASGPAYAVIDTFTDAGGTPSFIRGSDGVIYVATATMGSSGVGQVFRINPDGSGYAVIKAFPSLPNAALAPNSLIEGSDHVLYGTTANGGIATNNGTVFRVNKDGTGYAILRSFDTVSLGSGPNSIFEASDGALYGTTGLGGSGNSGVIFKLNKDGSGYTVVSAAYGTRGVIEGPGGALYATTAATTFSGAGGSVFKINKDGTAFAVLRNFAGGTDAAAPKAVLLLGSDGALYGTTSSGGTANRGTIYRLNSDGTGYVVLRNFLGDATDGGRLDAPLSEGADGLLYGATYSGGSGNRGTVFRLNKDGSGYTIVRNFLGSTSDGGVISNRILVGNDGTLCGATTIAGGDSRGVLFRMNSDGSAFASLIDFGAPNGSLPNSVTEASDGALYGSTYVGGGNGKGVVFKLNKDGSGFSVLHRFATTNDGNQPIGQIIEASNGVLYGVTLGGSPSTGVLFKLNKDGSGYGILHGFGAAGDASIPASRVLEGSDGALYGTTLAGGANGYGTVYRINKDGSGLTLLRSFANGSTDGNTPAGPLLEGANGQLYGTTSAGGTGNFGTVFAIAKDGSGFTVLHQFTGGVSDGSLPYSGLLRAADGRLYGTTNAGGPGGQGTVFGLNSDGTGYVVLKGFAGGSGDGAAPYYASITEKNGVLFGLTNLGGSFSGGTLFKLNRDGTGFEIVINFGLDNSDGRVPGNTLFPASDGALYGATNYGGNGGTIFRLRTN